MENAVTESDRLSGIDENVCILHDNTQNMFWVFDEKYETLSIHARSEFMKYFRCAIKQINAPKC